MQLLTDLDITNKRLLIRVDFNVPLNENGEITSDARIKATLPTIEYALSKKCGIILMSHLGRPVPGVFAEKFSLALVAVRLAELLNRPVFLVNNWQENNVELGKPGSICLLENIRFLEGEKENDLQLLTGKLRQLVELQSLRQFLVVACCCKKSLRL